MKKQSASIGNFVVFLLTGAIIVAIVFALGDNVLNLRVMKKTFSDQEIGISFEYPADFKVKATKSQNITFIDIYPNYDEGFEPKFIEIVVAKDNEPNVNFSDQIALMLNRTGTSGMARVHKGEYKGVRFARSTGTDKSIYTYYKAGGNLIMVKFNQQFYDVSNPLILTNNSPFTGVYFSIINSLQIYPVREGR